MQRLRSVGFGIFAVAAAVTAIRIGYLINNFSDPGPSFTVAGSSIGLWEFLMVVLMFVGAAFVVVAYFAQRSTIATTPIGEAEVQDPRFMRFLFGYRDTGSFWSAIRFYLGFAWLSAGYGKLMGLEGDWMTNGTALKGTWTAFIAGHQGAHPALAYDWYSGFLQYMLNNGWYTWFAKLVAIGETTIGILLVLGAIVGIAAFFGAVLNFNFGLAGSAGVNPLMLVMAIALVAAWKVAGYYGLDAYLLPGLGTPWQPGKVVAPKAPRPARLA